ncbi:MAG: tetratricopeptide repeat protein [Treponema sp.]
MLKLYIDYLKNKLKKLRSIKKDIPADFEEIVEEQWTADFARPQLCRFGAETGDGYTASFGTGERTGLVLEAQRKHLYAWTVNRVFRYKNAVIEADIHFDRPLAAVQTPAVPDNGTETAGSFAGGLLFRYISQSTFYALIISDAGWVRLDAVVNTTPMPILGWVKIPEPETPDTYNVKLITNNTSLTLIINGVWIACCEDDTIQAAGNTAFAVQNWETYPRAAVRLSGFRLNSVPLTVETAYTQANSREAVPAEARITLAKTFYAMGKYVPALLHLRTAARMREPTADERMLTGRIYFAQRLIAEAEQEFQAVLKEQPVYEEAIAELGGIYYRTSRYDELHTLLAHVPAAVIEQAPFLSNLQGHLLHSQQKYEAAAAAYQQAFERNPEQGLFAFHQANELYAAGKKPEAVEVYIQAARVFLQQENYDDLAETLAVLERIAPDDLRTVSLAGKYAYALGHYDTALLKLKAACKQHSEDSADWYLYGLLLKATQGKEAVKALKKACTLEPDCGLYQFRLAEALYLTGGKYGPVLTKALAADPENAWIHNLHALTALDEGDIERAEQAVARARQLLPDEAALLVNYLEVQRRKGQLTDCLPLFDIEGGTADLAVERNRAAAFHALANAFAADGARDEAQEWYFRAVKLNPKNPELLTDKAENDCALFLLNEADDGLVKALDLQPSVRIYQLIAAVSVQKGDYARAEITLRTGLESFSGSADLRYDLVCLYRSTRRFDLAQAQLQELKRYEVSDRVEALERILERGE